MNRFSYTLNKDGLKKEKHQYYSREELEFMTTYQLREICYREKIINGIQSPLDKDELIRQIMRFRGRKEKLFITKSSVEGMKRLETLIKTAKIHYQSKVIKGCAKITAYQGLSIEYFDQFTIGYHSDIVDTNALLVSGDEICAIFQVRAYQGDTKQLYLTKSEEIECYESSVRNYTLYCMDKSQSDLLYHIYMEEHALLPEHILVYSVPIMSFQVKEILESNMPLAIDFGTSNTTAGIYLDTGYLEQLGDDPAAERLKKDQVNYVYYLDVEKEEEMTPILPTVVGIIQVDGKNIQYAFGHQANRLFHKSYLEEGFCIFYDLKRWVSDADRVEEIADRNGHRSFVKRRDMIRAFLEYVIATARQRFKCNFKGLHISAPVKQKNLFMEFFKEIFPEYELEEQDMLDEGVAVIYNSISELVEKHQYEEGEEYKALVIDCGGGTTDLSSCTFRIEDQRVSYQIDIATAYENGDTNFGGNNLTYRIMQLLKISLARSLAQIEMIEPAQIIWGLGNDIFRRVDETSIKEVYGSLDEEYQKAEQVLPTKFKEYEHSSNLEYYAVKNNFYFLFQIAEQIKQEFFSPKDILRIAVSSIDFTETVTKTLVVDRWKLSVREGDGLHLIKDIPTVYLSIHELNRLLKADIYGIVKRFIYPSYENGDLPQYSILRLTGQSCKIELFRDALKEFIPGKIIESSKRENNFQGKYELKLICLDGAIKYLKDKKFGYANIRIVNEQPVFPYLITARTHTGEEKILIHSLDRENIRGYISRNMADLNLELILKNAEGQEQYKYNCAFNPKDFKEEQPENIVRKYRGEILQDDVDSIVNQELKFFVLADEERWGFHVVPVLRKQGQLMLGPEHFFLFETDGWVTNFFDGTK